MAIPRIVPDLVRWQAAAAPAATALMVDGGDALTFGQWDRRSNAVARGLVARGVRPGDRVGLRFDSARAAEYAVTWTGVHKAGGVAVPLGAWLGPAELAAVLAHCEAVGLVAPADLLPAQAALADTAVGWTAEPDAVEAGQDDADFQAPVDATAVADILYTSGTTGTPKGVACPHDNILLDVPPDTSPEPNLAGDGPRMPFLHAFAIGANAAQECLRVPLRRGERVAVIMPVFDPERACALVAEHRAGVVGLVPSMAKLLVASGAPARHDVSSVRRIALGGAPAPAALLPQLTAAFPNAAVWNPYGLTETGTARTVLVYDPRDPVDPARLASVGRAVAGREVRIVDEAGEPVAAGQVGEVWLRRVGAPRRFYFGDEAATAAAFAGEWLRTGDLGYLDADGYLFLVDRKKDVIISGGFNVGGVEVEDVLHAHPAVADAAVFGVPHEVLGQDVAAAVVLDPGVQPAPGVRELQAFVRARLAEYKVPHRVVFVDELPRNATGKVVKRALRERFADAGRADGPGGRVAPRTTLEATIAGVWQEVLGLDAVGVHDEFLDVGGHSLAAGQVLARLEQALGCALPLEVVFEAPTVAELAAAIADLPAAVPLVERG